MEGKKRIIIISIIIINFININIIITIVVVTGGGPSQRPAPGRPAFVPGRAGNGVGVGGAQLQPLDGVRADPGLRAPLAPRFFGAAAGRNCPPAVQVFSCIIIRNYHPHYHQYSHHPHHHHWCRSCCDYHY